MKKHLLTNFGAAMMLILFTGKAYCQLTIASPAGVSGTALVNNIVTAALSPVFINEQGLNAQRSTFTAAGASATALGMVSGIVITTGTAVAARADGNGSCCYANLNHGVSGGDDANLGALIGRPATDLNDTYILEFDITVPGPVLQIEYVFGSEEYPIYEGSGTFNDAFAFFISGPGIAGVQNMALVPGTTSNVSVRTINSTINSGFYVNNHPSCSWAALGTFGCGFLANGGSNTSQIEYNGYTTPLVTRTAVLAGSTYRIKLVIADVGDGALDSGVFIQASSVALPVNLLNFDAKWDNNESINLNWATATETNNKVFNIERSTNLTDYEVIGSVAGNGNSTSFLSYQFTDANPEEGVNYYRLKQVDFDGKFQYSEVTSANFVSNIKTELLSSNPIQEHLKMNISMPEAGEVTVEILDITGNLISKTEYLLNEGSNEIEQITADLKSGIYFMRVSGSIYKGTLQKIVK